jgi:uncharacterized repeat protein (TIGR01451 family)
VKSLSYLKTILLVFVALVHFYSFSQNIKPFTTRFDVDLKGDMLLIGNNIFNRNNGSGQRPNDPYNGTGLNSSFTMEYIDIDGDGTTFNSSSANLTIPNPSCFRIRYAGLYWGAMLTGGDRTQTNRVKFKLPTGGYNDILGTLIHDTGAVGNNSVYASYADVTALLTGLVDPQGTYTVANVVGSTGSNGGTGLCGGWTLFLVYEDPTLPGKYITSFDGFSTITSATGTLDIAVSGFKTIPVGPVRAGFAFSALEGDQGINGDYLRINGTLIGTAQRPSGTPPPSNFFNSSINTPAGNFTARVPNSTNTLGFDAGLMLVNNPSNAVINNGDTSATIQLGSTQDTYFYFFNAFAVEIIQPQIVLTKQVLDDLGNDVGGTNVTLGQQLNYVINFQNIGNDDVTGFTIKDVLPINVIFNYPADLDLTTLPVGVTHSYDPATRTILFTIPDNLVLAKSGLLSISLGVQVVPSCDQLNAACSNFIGNQAFATYKGIFNTAQITNDPSLANFSVCNLGNPQATNFLVDVSGCTYSKSEVLCGNSLQLTAAAGYVTYSWSTSPTGIPVIGTGQTITVSQPGTYYVHDTASASCLSIVETITVIRFGSGVANPIIPFADQVVNCPNDGKALPYIFL